MDRSLRASFLYQDDSSRYFALPEPAKIISFGRPKAICAVFQETEGILFAEKS